MRVWVLTVLYDDGDPGDRAHVSEVYVFGTLQGARDALNAITGLKVDAEPEDLREDFPDMSDEMILEECRLQPELYTWISGDRDSGWSGGDIVTITEAGVQ